jgi:hypothetical protein
MARPSRMNAVEQFGHPTEAFAHNPQHARRPFALPRLDHGGGTNRQQTDHGAHLGTRCTAIGKPQDVVLEPILFVPHATRAGLIDAAGDPKEMVKELDGHVFEEGVVGRQLRQAQSS